MSGFIYRCSEAHRVQIVKEVTGESSFSLEEAGEEYGFEIPGFHEREG